MGYIIPQIYVSGEFMPHVVYYHHILCFCWYYTTFCMKYHSLCFANKYYHYLIKWAFVLAFTNMVMYDKSFNFVLDRGIEPLFSGWKPDVLTVRRTGHGEIFGLYLATLELLNLDMNKSLKPFYFIPNLVLRMGLEPMHVRLKVLRLNHLAERSIWMTLGTGNRCGY